MKVCNKCGEKNPDEARFCGRCGEELIDGVTSQRVVVIEQKANVYVKVSMVLVIISAIISIFANNIFICAAGLTFSVASMVTLAIGYLKNKMQGIFRLSLFLNIYSFAANFIWLAYHLWIAPNL